MEPTNWSPWVPNWPPPHAQSELPIKILRKQTSICLCVRPSRFSSLVPFLRSESNAIWGRKNTEFNDNKSELEIKIGNIETQFSSDAEQGYHKITGTLDIL